MNSVFCSCLITDDPNGLAFPRIRDVVVSSYGRDCSAESIQVFFHSLVNLRREYCIKELEDWHASSGSATVGGRNGGRKVIQAEVSISRVQELPAMIHL